MADELHDAANVPTAAVGKMRETWVGIADRAHEVIADRIKDKRHEFLTEFLENAEQELAPYLQPQIRELLDSGQVPEPLRPVLVEAIAPEHQTGALIGGLAVGAAISPAIAAAFAPFIVGLQQNVWQKDPVRALTPSELAVATVKNVKTTFNKFSEATKSGIDDARFQMLIDISGRSYGIELALMLWRRGDITEDELDKVIHYSDTRDDFIPDIKKARYVPLTVGEVITAALKHHLDPAAAKVALGHAGTNPIHFDTLLASAGRPLGLQEMLHLLNRQKMTEADVRQGIAQSDVNDDYADWAIELRHYFPPMRSIVAMLRNGAIDVPLARKWMGYYGATDEVQDAFIREGQRTSSEAVKNVTQAQVVGMYVDRLLNRGQASAKLQSLYFAPADVTLLLDFADDKRHEQLVASAARALGTKYVGYRIDRAECHDKLIAAGVPTDAVADMLRLWDLQRDANAHDATPSQIVGAGRRHLLSPLQVRTRLVAAGVDGVDLQIIVADGWPPTAAAEAVAAAHAVAAGDTAWPGSAPGGGLAVKNLTVTQISQLYTAGTIGRAEALADLGNLGYTPTQAAQLLSTFTQPAIPKP